MYHQLIILMKFRKWSVQLKYDFVSFGRIFCRSRCADNVHIPQVYHPNIDFDGNICLNILREDWKPVLGINHILMGLEFIFVVRTTFWAIFGSALIHMHINVWLLLHDRIQTQVIRWTKK